MDENKRILRVIEKTQDVTEEQKEVTKPKFAHPNQTNPIYKKMATFHNEKVGDKWSINDLLR